MSGGGGVLVHLAARLRRAQRSRPLCLSAEPDQRMEFGDRVSGGAGLRDADNEPQAADRTQLNEIASVDHSLPLSTRYSDDGARVTVYSKGFGATSAESCLSFGSR